MVTPGMLRDRDELIRYARRKGNKNSECVFSARVPFRKGVCAYCAAPSNGDRTCSGLCRRAFDATVCEVLLADPPPRSAGYLPPWQLLTNPARSVVESFKALEFSSCVGVLDGGVFHVCLNDDARSEADLGLVSSAPECLNCLSPAMAGHGLVLPRGGWVVDAFCSTLCRAAFSGYLGRMVAPIPRALNIYPMYSLDMDPRDRVIFDSVKHRDDYVPRSSVHGEEVLIELSDCK